MLSFTSGRLRWLVCALALAGAAAAVQAADVKWKDRGDRNEGIRAQNIAGGDFELLGVHAEPESRQRGATRLWVSVPVRQSTELRVRVWEPTSGYEMVPKRPRFAPGDAFSWSRVGVLAAEGIEAEQLYVRATNPLETLYYPARLTTAAPPDEVTRYVFRFRSRGGLGLDETIFREDEEGRLLEVRTRRHDEEFGGPLEVVWDGRTAGGADAPAGVYHLRLDGTLYLKVDRELKIDLPFIHHGEMAP